jgi:anti-anti-sigma factor
MVVQVDGSEVGEAGGRPGARGEVVVGYHDGVVVLTLVGEHDLATANQLVAKITHHASSGHPVVVVLSEVEFIDSAIVTALFNGERQMLAFGRRLVIQNNAESPVTRLLEISGLRTKLVCTDSFRDAVRFAAQRRPVLTTG